MGRKGGLLGTKVVLSCHDLHNIFQDVVFLDPVVLYEWSVPVPVKLLSLPDTTCGNNTDGNRFDQIHVRVFREVAYDPEDSRHEVGIGVEFRFCNVGWRDEKVS